MARRSAADAAATRAEILRAARTLFTAQGFTATTTAQVAEAAGVTAGALFHHFGDKAGLFREVFGEIEAELDATVREKAEGLHGIEAFLQGFRTYLEFAKRRDFHRIVMIEGPVVFGPGQWRALDQRLSIATMMEGLEELIAEGVIEDRPRQPLGTLLVGAMSSAGIEVARNGSRRNIDALVDAMRYLLMPHLTPGARRVAAAAARKARA